MYHICTGLHNYLRTLSWFRAQDGPAAGSRGSGGVQEGSGGLNSHDARPAHLIITTVKWIRTSSLSIQNSLSLHPAGASHGQGEGRVRGRGRGQGGQDQVQGQGQGDPGLCTLPPQPLEARKVCVLNVG